MLWVNGRPGLYVVFEGGVGAGKTVQQQRALARFKQEYPYLTFVGGREPGTTPLAEELRPLLKNQDIHPEIKAAMFHAVRVETMLDFIIPHVDQGHGVLMDRSFMSSLANQGEGEGLGFDYIWNLNSRNVHRCWPDAVILLDRETERALGDSSANEKDSDHWDKKGVSYHELVRRGYRKAAELVRKCSPRTLMLEIDATGKDEPKVFDEVWFRLSHIFPEWQEGIKQLYEGRLPGKERR